MKTYIQNTAIVGLVVIVVLGLMNVFGLSFPLMVTTTTKSTELSVVGEGKVEAVPDTASINVGISVDKAPTVEVAQKQIDTVNNAIIAAITKLGVDKKQIQTGNYSISPNYNFDGSDRKQDGFMGDVQLTITVKDTKMVTQIVQAATAAGATNIYGTSYSIDKPEKYREEARNKAIANAKEQANKLASSLGIRLGKVTNIVESSAGAPVAMYDKAVMSAPMSGGGTGAEFEAGTQTVQSVVTLYFEKKWLLTERFLNDLFDGLIFDGYIGVIKLFKRVRQKFRQLVFRDTHLQFWMYILVSVFLNHSRKLL